ncbi:pentapeptide repeat-containing protein [Methylobacterium sp. Leaf112]|uniref:pentapeptide repeat-containing protein n=1 Tax=Methylobacterium sp. Leaf112 TaxID=1736258 RepID=UPI003FCE16D3
MDCGTVFSPLSGLAFSGADLSGAILSGAILSGVCAICATAGPVASQAATRGTSRGYERGIEDSRDNEPRAPRRQRAMGGEAGISGYLDVPGARREGPRQTRPIPAARRPARRARTLKQVSDASAARCISSTWMRMASAGVLAPDRLCQCAMAALPSLRRNARIVAFACVISPITSKEASVGRGSAGWAMATACATDAVSITATGSVATASAVSGSGAMSGMVTASGAASRASGGCMTGVGSVASSAVSAVSAASVGWASAGPEDTGCPAAASRASAETVSRRASWTDGT